MSTDPRVSTDSPTSPVTVPRGAGRLYFELWRGVPRELLFLLLSLPVALVGFTVTIGLFASGFGSIWTFFIGIVLVILALYVSRAFGLLELIRLDWAGRPRISRPEWQDARARQGFVGWLRSVLGNGHYWLYLLHTMLVGLLVSVVTWTLTVFVLAGVFGGVTAWFWNSVPEFLGLAPLAVIGLFLVGLALLAALPFVTRGLVLLHHVVARGMLGAFRSDGLQRELIAANASGRAAAAAEGQSLRKLERDLHDGPQQRLVRLQMDLAAVDRQLDTDPEKARAILAEAMQQSKDALEELRALSRGFAPPILLDRGLVAALESAATRSPVPTRVVSSLPLGTTLPRETERNAYLVASEAITNAAKHSGATAVVVRLDLVEEEVQDAAAPRFSPLADAWLVLGVTDDGVGGAVPIAGHGLEGLDERLRGLGGLFTLDSPAGGPTTLTARFPLVR